MSFLSFFLACLIPSFFLALNAFDPSLVRPDDTNLPILHSPSKSSNDIEPICDFLPPCETGGDVDAGTSPTLGIPNLFPLGETIDDVEASTAASSSTHGPAIPNTNGSLLPSGMTDSNVEASTTSMLSVRTLAIPDPFASVLNLSAHTRVIPNSSVAENITSYHAISIELGPPEISQVTSSSLSHYVETPRNGSFSSRDGPFNLGQTNMGLTFQAALAFMDFHLQGSFSANTRSISFNLVGVAVIIGFTFSVISIFLRKVCPRLATLGDYISLFSTAFGFFMMLEMVLPDSISWTVWPACVFVFLAFVFALARTS